MPGLTKRKRYWPIWLVSVLVSTPVCTLTSTRAAPATEAVDGSVTVPLRVARVSCPITDNGSKHAAVSDPIRAFRNEYRSEEHTSELQSLRHLVCRLLLEKKKRT